MSIFYEIIRVIVVDSSNGFSNAPFSGEKRSFTLLDPAFTQEQAHRECARSSQVNMSRTNFRGIEYSSPSRSMTHLRTLMWGA